MAAGNNYKVNVRYNADIGPFVRNAKILAHTINKLNLTIKQPAQKGGTTTFVNQISTMTKKVNNLGHAIINQFSNVANAFRIAAQGVMTFGRALTTTITPLAGLALFGAAKAAIDFNDAMVRVAKTTGFTKKQLAVVNTGLRELAVTTATGVVELADLAEQIGQIGVQRPESVVALTDVFNQLLVATDVAADSVAVNMGKIANAFGMDLNTEEGVEQISKMASVINELENQTEASAPEIIEGMLNLAEAGSLLNFDPVSGAAMVATLVSVGYSAEEAGTALRNFMIKTVQNAEEVAAVMQQVWGGDAADAIKRMNEDAAGALLDLIAAAGEGNEAAQTLFTTIEIGGIRGGKGWASLAAALGDLKTNLALSNEEFEKGTSLMIEYEKALLSTKNQMGVLKNNLSEIALTLGDSLLPILNKAIQTVIPPIRYFAAELKKLSPAAQLNIIKFVAFAAILGPVIMIASQFAFTVSMIAMAFFKLLSVLWTVNYGFVSFGVLLLKGFTKIGALIKGAGALFGLFKGGAIAVLGLKFALVALGITVLGLILKFTGLGEKIAEWFLDLAGKAAAWGETLVGTFAGGMMAGAVKFLAKVLTAIGNFIGKFFAGHSPPDAGPLSHIDLWGRNVFDAFLQGMTTADFGVLSKLGNTIGKILSTLSKSFKEDDDKTQFLSLLEARQNLAKLLSLFNKTGQISESVLAQVVKDLGNASDEVAQLIRLWVKYTDIQRQLEELEQHRQDTIKSYADEIDAVAISNRSAEERVNLIRASMQARDRELRDIAIKEEALKAEETQAKKTLDLQEAMVEAMQEQDDIQLQLIKTLDKLSGSLSDIEDFAGGGWDFEDPEDQTKSLEDMFEGFLTLEQQIHTASSVWEAFLLGFKGGSPEGLKQIKDDFRDIAMSEVPAWAKDAVEKGGLPIEQFSPTMQGIDSAYAQGKNLGDIFTELKGTFKKLEDAWNNLSKKLDIEQLTKDFKELIKTIEKLPEKIKEAFTGLTEGGDKQKKSGKFGPSMEPKPNTFLSDFTEGFNSVSGALGGSPSVNTLLSEFINLIEKGLVPWKIAAGILKEIAIGLGWYAEGITEGTEASAEFPSIGETIGKVFSIVMQVLQHVMGILLGAIGMLISWGLWLSGLGAIWATLLIGLGAAWAAMFATISYKWFLFVLELKRGWDDFKRSMEIKLLILEAKFRGWVEAFKSLLSVETLKQAGKDFLEGLKKGFEEKYPEVYTALENMLKVLAGLWALITQQRSPSHLMMEGGVKFVEGLEIGIKDEMPSLEASMTDLSNMAHLGLPSYSDSISGVGDNTENSSITLNFGKDSVRSEDDIKKIVAEVERALNKKTKIRYAMG